MKPDRVTRPDPLLLLMMMIVMILYRGNDYLHTFEFPACDAWVIVLSKFLLLLCVSSVSLL